MTDARFTPQPNGATYGNRSADRAAYFGTAETVPVHHLHECWQHNDIASLAQMIAATRELLAGTAVCDDPEHDASALPEWLDIAEQNEAISRKG